MNQPALYAIVPAPWGPIHVAATNRGVAGLELLTPTERFVARIERRLRREVVSTNRHPGRAADRLDEAVAAVEAYLAGDAVSFELPLDIGDRPGWDRLVLGGVRGVPFGRVTSYGRIARRVGKPGRGASGRRGDRAEPGRARHPLPSRHRRRRLARWLRRGVVRRPRGDARREASAARARGDRPAGEPVAR